MLTRLYNAVYEAERIPSAWRQGVVTHLPKGGDGGDCSNYRPLTLMPVIDKLFAAIVSARLMDAIALHDQQYAFRPGRGTPQALATLMHTIRRRTQAGLPTFACFFDAPKAYDSVPHDLLLYRLLQKGVTGKAFAVVDRMYSSAYSRVRVDGVLSSAFPVQRGVAQGCPLSPLLYAVFIDSVLDDLNALPPDGLVSVPAPGWERTLPGQAYADDLCGLAATPGGAQRVVDVVFAHSRRWGWSLNIPKSVLTVFGPVAVRREHASVRLRWGPDLLPRSALAKYLGVLLEDSGLFGAQQAAAAARGWRALGRWMPALKCVHLTAATKSTVIRTRVAPCMLYGMELWPVSTSGADLDAVLVAAAKVVADVRPLTSCPGWVRNRSVSNEVLLTDLDMLASADHCRVAHARQLARDRVGDAATSALRAHDPLSAEFTASLPAGVSPDYMGAAVRASMHKRDAWLRRAAAAYDLAVAHMPVRVTSVRDVSALVEAAAGTAADGGGPATLRNSDARAGITAWARQQRCVGAPVSAVALGPLAGRLRKRPRPPPVLRNPLARGLCLPDSGVAPYTRSPSCVVYPILSLRSSHLPGDYAVRYGDARSPHACLLCECEVYEAHAGLCVADPREHRWRHIEHLLLSCPCVHPPEVCRGASCLRSDLLRAVDGDVAARAVVDRAFPATPDCDGVLTACTVPFLLDPAAALPSCVSQPARGLCCRLVAAFLAGTGSRISALCSSEPVAVPPVWLPRWARLRVWSSDLCALLEVACVDRSSAPVRRGAVADARLGLA